MPSHNAGDDKALELVELDHDESPTPGNVRLDKTNGTVQDAQDMHRLGKKQLFQRNFRFLPILGFTCTLMATWEGVVASAGLALSNGGTAGFIWTFLWTIFCFGAVIASMADMASMAPTTGGQYHWVSEFAPKNYQKFLSYIVGWTSALGWQCGVASASFLSGTMIQGLIVLNKPAYEPQRWQGSLFMIAIMLLCTFVNTLGARHLPLLEGLILFLHIFGFFAIIIPLWVLAPRISASRAFGEFYNGGGWESAGAACMIAQLASIFSFIGPDGAAHMAEEVRDASKTVPLTMISTVFLNGALGLVMIITFCFCITDLEAALDSATGYPFIEVFYASTGSKAGATAMTVILIALIVCCGISQLATASRQTFAFARDEALPFSGTLMKVTKVGVQIPLNAILLSLSIAIIFALINIGSTAAFNAIVSLLVAAEFTSYLISIGCVLLKRLRGEPLPPSRWSMGRFAIPVNIFAIAYIIFVFVMSFFPSSRVDLTAESMNWACVVYVGILGIAVAVYVVHGRHIYKGPVVYVRRTE